MSGVAKPGRLASLVGQWEQRSSNSPEATPRPVSRPEEPSWHGEARIHSHKADYEEDVSDEEDEVTGMHLEEPVDTKQINLIDLATSPDSSSKSLPFGADLSPLNPTPGSGFAAYMQQVPQASRGYAPSEQDEVDLDALEAYLAEDLAEAVPGADQEIISGLQREEIVFYEEQGGEDSEEGDDLETELFAASAHQQTDHSKDGYEAIAPGPNIRGAYNTLVAGDEEFDISDQEDEREGEREGEGKEEGKGDLGSISLDTPVAVLDNRTASVTPVADEEFDVDDGEKDEDQLLTCGQGSATGTARSGTAGLMNLGYEEEFGDDYSYDGVLDTSMSYPSDPADQETPVMKNLASMLAAADTSPEASPILLRHDRAIPKGVPQRPEFEVPSDKTEAESPRLMGGCLEADQGLPVLDDEEGVSMGSQEAMDLLSGEEPGDVSVEDEPLVETDAQGYKYLDGFQPIQEACRVSDESPAFATEEDILLDTASVGDNGDVGVPDPEETQLPTEAGPWAFPQSAAMDSLAEENRVRVVADSVAEREEEDFRARDEMDKDVPLDISTSMDVTYPSNSNQGMDGPLIQFDDDDEAESTLRSPNRELGSSAGAPRPHLDSLDLKSRVQPGHSGGTDLPPAPKNQLICSLSGAGSGFLGGGKQTGAPSSGFGGKWSSSKYAAAADSDGIYEEFDDEVQGDIDGDSDATPCDGPVTPNPKTVARIDEWWAMNERVEKREAEAEANASKPTRVPPPPPPGWKPRPPTAYEENLSTILKQFALKVLQEQPDDVVAYACRYFKEATQNINSAPA